MTDGIAILRGLGKKVFWPSQAGLSVTREAHAADGLGRVLIKKSGRSFRSGVERFPSLLYQFPGE